MYTSDFFPPPCTSIVSVIIYQNTEKTHDGQRIKRDEKMNWTDKIFFHIFYRHYYNIIFVHIIGELCCENLIS